MPEIADLVRDLAVVALMVVMLDTVPWLRRATWAVALAGGMLAALTVYQGVTKTYDQDFLGLAVATQHGSLYRSNGPTSSVFFAQALVGTGLLSLYLWVAGGRRFARAVALASFGLCLVGIGLTASRASVLSIGVALLIATALRPRRLLLPLVGVTIALGVAVPTLSADYIGRFQSLASVASAPSTEAFAANREGSLKGRLSENIAAWRMFVDNPILGVGPDNYPDLYPEYSSRIGLDPRVGVQTPHNLVLEAMAERGAVGTAALLALLGVALAGAWRARRTLATSEGVLAEGTFVALVGFLVNGLFLHASTPRYLFTMVGLALVAGRLGQMAGRRARPAGGDPSGESSGAWRAHPEGGVGLRAARSGPRPAGAS